MRALAVLLLSTAVSTMNAGELRVLAPTGDYELWNEGEKFVINPRGINGFFSSDKLPELNDSVERTAQYAIWNPDGRMIAVCVRTGKDIEDTFVLFREKDSFRYLKLPYEDWDYHVIPLRWLDTNRLLVEISGPYGGKADKEVRRYTMTFRYDKVKRRFTAVSATKPQTNGRSYE